MLMALFIVIIFGMSSLAFVVLYGTGPVEPQQQQNTLDSFVIDGDINQALEFEYINKGYTFLRFYYVDNEPLLSIVEQIPDTYPTNLNQRQVFVLKIPSNETYMKISNLNGENEIYNITNEKIFDIMCENLIVTPSECGLAKLLNQTNTSE